MRFSRFRSARPSDQLPALKRFYVDLLGCELLGEWLDHSGYDGLVVGDRARHWEAEFLHQRGAQSPPPPSDEHLLVFYVQDETEIHLIADRLKDSGLVLRRHPNPYWETRGVFVLDPDGYGVVISLQPPNQLKRVVSID
jgi:catechol 2,3-dioxygenase-like lactoylglutathione lyase family enzyme